MEYVDSYKDLKVYRLARQLAKEVFEVSKTFPKEETYSLTDQLRRSSRSIGGQIAESWGKRYYERHFVSKLTDADGEQFETQHWLDTASDCDYLTKEIASRLIGRYQELGKMIGSMIDKSHLFCKKRKTNL